MVVEWVKNMPPIERGLGARGRRIYEWEDVAQELKTKPGEWALIYEGIPRAHAGNIRAGLNPAFQPPEDFLVRTKGPRGSRADLYMCFVGAPGARTRAARNQQ